MKLNPVLCSFSILAVFASGLVSCGPDQNKVAPAFRLPPPQVIQVGERSLEWAEFTQMASPELDDAAYLKLDPQARAPGVRARVKSQCGLTDRVQTHSVLLHQPETIRIGDVIPTESLLNPQGKLNCRMDITFINANGSTHIFPALDFKLKTRIDGSGLTFKQDSVATANLNQALELPTSEWNRYSIAPGLDTKSIDLECEYHRIPIPSRGSELIFLAQIDLAKAIARPKVNGDPSRIPEQLCRVVEHTRLGRRGYSPILRVRFPSVRIKAWFEPVKVYARGRWALLGISELKNFEDQPVKIELPKPGDLKIKVLVVGDPAGIAPVYLPLHFTLAQDRTQTTVTVPPGGKVRLEARVYDRIHCRTSNGLTTKPRRHLLFFTQENVGPWILEERPEGVARGRVATPWPPGEVFGYSFESGKMITPEPTNWRALPEAKELCGAKHN